MYLVQIGLCEQLLSHLGKYQQQDREQASTTSSTRASPTEASVPFEGMKAVKKDENSDGFEGLPSSYPVPVRR